MSLVLFAGLLCVGLTSCKEIFEEPKEDYYCTLSFRASPSLSQSLGSRFRVSLFTDGIQDFVTDIPSVKTVNEGFSFDVVRGEEYELSVTYGWPYGSEWYKSGALSIPVGQMIPPVYGCYIRNAFPSGAEAKKPVGLAFNQLFYEFVVAVTGESDIKYEYTFETTIAGFSWPQLVPLVGQYRCSAVITGTGHTNVRIPVIADNDVVDIIFRRYDLDDNPLGEPVRQMAIGREISGKDGNAFSIVYKTSDGKTDDK